MKRLGVWVAGVLALVGVARPVHAHPVPFSYVDVHIDGTVVELVVVAHIFDLGHDLAVDPSDRLLDPSVLKSKGPAYQQLVTDRLQLDADGSRLSGIEWLDLQPLGERQSARLTGRYHVSTPPGRLTITARMFPYDPVHQTFVNVYEADALTSQAILDKSHDRFEYFSGTRQGIAAVVRKFVLAGIHHILIGPDHLLFLMGLLLLGGSTRRLLLIVSGFTVAHSITLSLAALNIVSPPARLIEPAIALSIVYVGADNLLVRGGRDVRAWIAFAFGFVHGFGFANVLREMDLPRRALGWSLFSFNVGVEIGQLMVVLAVASALVALRSRSEWAGRQLAVAGSLVVIAAGTFWFIQRVFFPAGLS